MWKDEFLAWAWQSNAHLLVDYKKNWLPVDGNKIWKAWDLAIMSNPSDMSALLRRTDENNRVVVVNRDGVVEWFPKGLVESKCQMDLTMFPFDDQYCDIRVESWDSPDFEIKIKFEKDYEGAFIRMKNQWVENSEWLITDNYSISGRVMYVDDYCYEFVIFRIFVKRNPLFHIINIIIPSGLISVAELVTFLLPIEDPTRVQISFTCLLAYTMFQVNPSYSILTFIFECFFFQNMIIQMIPRSISVIPLLSLFIDLQMVYIGVICILGETFVFLLLSKGKESAMPPSKRFLTVIKAIGHKIGVKHNENPMRNVPIDTSDIANNQTSDFFDLIQVHIIFKHWQKYTRFKIATDRCREKWNFVALVVFRVNFITYTALLFVTPLVLFLIGIYTESPKPDRQEYMDNC